MAHVGKLTRFWIIKFEEDDGLNWKKNIYNIITVINNVIYM